MNLNLEEAIVAYNTSATGASCVLCVEAKSGNGIEVGDQCLQTETHYVPMIRRFTENGCKKPFRAISISDAMDFKFKPIHQ